MGFGDLPAEHQADSGATGLRREKRHEEVRRVGKAGPIILHKNFN